MDNKKCRNFIWFLLDKFGGVSNLLETAEVRRELGDRLDQSKMRLEKGEGIEVPEGMSLFEFYQLRRGRSEE